MKSQRCYKFSANVVIGIIIYIVGFFASIVENIVFGMNFYHNLDIELFVVLICYIIMLLGTIIAIMGYFRK